MHVENQGQMEREERVFCVGYVFFVNSISGERF